MFFKKRIYKKSYLNDIALSLALKVFGLKYLHYGYFDKKLKPSLQNLPKAQENYVSHLIAHIPKKVHSILDVGCGSGEIAKKLLQKGFSVTCVAPDPFLISETKKVTNNRANSITCKYEDLQIKEGKGKFDLILMAESCQYITIQPGWQQNKHFLNSGKYVLIADAFKIKPMDDPLLSKSGHDLKNYIACAKKNGFKLIMKEDITSNVAATMDIGSDIITRYAFPITEALGKALQRRYPLGFKFFCLLFRKKLHKIQYKYSHQTAEVFQLYKKYFILLFEKI